MSAQENPNLAQQAYACFQSGDIPALLNLLSDDIQWQLPDIENIPFSGKRQGREAVGQFFASIADLQDVLAFEPREFIVQGDTIVALGRYHWRVKATGREFQSEWVHIFATQGGKVVGFREHFDTAVAAAAYQQARSAE